MKSEGATGDRLPEGQAGPLGSDGTGSAGVYWGLRTSRGMFVCQLMQGQVAFPLVLRSTGRWLSGRKPGMERGMKVPSAVRTQVAAETLPTSETGSLPPQCPQASLSQGRPRTPEWMLPCGPGSVCCPVSDPALGARWEHSPSPAELISSSFSDSAFKIT